MAFLKEYFQIKNWVPYDQSQRRRMMTFVLWSTMVAGILLGLVNLYLKARGAATILFALSILCMVGLRLNHYGHYVSTGVLIGLMVLIALDFNLIDGNGSRDTGIVALPIFVMLGSLLFGKRSVPGFTLAAVGSAILVTYLSVHGDIPRAYHASFNDGITISILVVVSAVLTWAVMDTLEKDVKHIRQSETSLRTSYDLTLQSLEERKRAEEALRESEARYRAISELISDYTFSARVESDGKIVPDWIAGAFQQITGYSWEEFIARGSWPRIVHPDDLPNDQLDQEALLDNRSINRELRIVTKSGEVRWILNFVRPVWNEEQGRVTKFIGAVSDITERKRAEEALRESEERFSRLSAASFEGIAITDRGRIMDANPQLAYMLGYKPGELIGLSAIDFVAPASRDLVTANERADIVGPYEHLAMKKDGSIFPVEIRARTIPYKGRQTRVAIIRDITERKKAEEALRESEERYRSLFEGVPVGLYRSTLSGQILDVNLAGVRMLGYEDREELIADNDSDFWVDPEARKQLASQMDRDGTFDLEIQMRRRDRKTIWVHNRGRAFRDEQGQVLYFDGSLEDITERKRAEEALALQVERLSALHTIDEVVISSLDLSTILELLVREVVKQLPVDACSILLINPQTQTLDFAARQGFRTEALKFTRLKIGTGLSGRAVQDRKTIYVENLAELVDNPSLAQSIAKEEFVTYFGIPLIAKDQMLGVLEIFHRSTLPADPNWLTFLETLAGQAAISIDNARLLEITQAHLKETDALYRINQGLVAYIDPGQLMRDVVDLLQKNFGYFYVQIFIREPETGDFVVRAGSGKIGKQLIQQGYRLAAGEGIISYTAETGTPFFTNDVDNVVAFKRIPLLPDTKSELAVPIRTAESFLGLLDVHQAPPALLTQSDSQLVSTVANQLAVALQQAKLYTDLQNALRQEQETRSQLIHAEKLAVAGRLLASVSHELNNPLQAIQNALYLLKEEKRISVQGRHDLKTVLAESERMATLLERLRTTYQPARAEDFQPVQINDIIEDVHTLVATHLRHARISFEFHSDPDLPSIPGLGNQLKQVMLNLFMNAVDAMAGGGHLTVSTRWLSENREVLITVTDTGAGIDESILPYIFEAFITNKEKGTGLGLAISYEIILKHRGRIQAENNPEGGVTFSIWLTAGDGGTQ